MTESAPSTGAATVGASAAVTAATAGAPSTGAATAGASARAASLVHALTALGHSLACAESLTAGLVSAGVADVPGASAVLAGGIVAYSPAAKSALLGVPSALLQERGTVDEQVARAMAEGALRRFSADWAVSTTGVAGPGPAEGQPAGTVWVGLAGRGRATTAHLFHLPGDRQAVRSAAAWAALDVLARALPATPPARDAAATPGRAG